jgi:hypothetical protein
MHDHQVALSIAPRGRQNHKAKQDNKVRLSQDVLEKADRIAAEWGLKNARAAVEAVFRRYCDDYLQGCPPSPDSVAHSAPVARKGHLQPYGGGQPAAAMRPSPTAPKCEALDALDQLLAP